MTPRKRWIPFRLTLAAIKVTLLIAGVVLSIQTFVLPPLVRSALSRSLKDAGFHHAQFELRSVSLSSADLIDFSLDGTERASVAAMSVDFAPAELLQGRIRALRVTGARLEVSLVDGKWDLGPLSLLMDDSSGGSAPNRAGRLPFTSIELRSSLLRVQADSQSYAVPMSALLTTDNSELKLNLVLPSLRMGGHVARDTNVHLTRAIGSDDLAVRVSTTINGWKVESLTATITNALDAGASQWNVASQGRASQTIAPDQAVDWNWSGQIHREGEGLVVRGDPASHLRLHAGALPSPIVLEMSSPGGRALVRREGSVTDVHLELQTREAVSVRTAGAEMSAGKASLSMHAHLSGNGLQLRGLLDIADGALSAPGSGLELAGVSLRAPIDFGRVQTGEDARPHLRIANVTWHGSRLPEVEGQVSVRDGLATLNAGVFLESPVRIGTTQIAGGFSTRARAQWTNGKLVPTAQLNLHEVSFSQPEMQLTGINTQLNLDSLDPLHSRPSQRLSISHAAFGEHRFSDATLLFRIEDSQSVLVERLSTGFADGRISAESFRVDLREPQIDSVISLEQLQLAKVLPMMSEDVSGTGRLYGRVPLKIRWDRLGTTTAWESPQISLAGGFLYASPEGGRLRLSNPQEMLGTVLTEQDARFSKGGPLESTRNQLIRAFADLNYSTLRVDIIPEQTPAGQQLLARLFIEGRPHSRPDDRPATLTLNLRPLDHLLKRLFTYRSALALSR